jgi:hypothetical protein
MREHRRESFRKDSGNFPPVKISGNFPSLLVRAFVYGRASKRTIIGLIRPESARGCRFQGVTALALTTLWKPWVFAINLNNDIVSRDAQPEAQ